jgi:hypothetical protein
VAELCLRLSACRDPFLRRVSAQPRQSPAGVYFGFLEVPRGLPRINEGLDAYLYMGNLVSPRDRGHAPDYVEM